jgi:hypothetical protein
MKCGAFGALIVGGRVVGAVKCDLEAGHDEPTMIPTFGGGLTQPYDAEPGTPHAMTLTWTPESDPDLDLFDVDEHFDVDVPLITWQGDEISAGPSAYRRDVLGAWPPTE